MASKCTITFDNNPIGVFYAGQVVSGTAELITGRPKTVRSINIIVSGYAEVRWTEDIQKQNAEGKPEKAIETFSGSELYYSSEKCVYGQSGGSQLELPAGKYVFPFQATIPPNAPTSFNGAWGQIQHEVTLSIDRVMRYDNTFKQAYTVLSPFDLNLNPEHAKPLQKIDEKTFCWGLCCGSQGPMVMKVFVQFSAYAPGQKIRFNIVLDNQSNVNCNDVKVRLMKKVTYTSRSPAAKQQVTEIKVADNHCGEVVKQNKAEFNEFLQIPSTTPTSLESCSIIKVSYTLRFIAKVSLFYGDLVIDFPFTIGTVPLYASTANNVGPITMQPSAAPVYKPLPPPTFEEDVRSEQYESNTFKPRYPVFLADSGLNNVKHPNNIPSTQPDPKVPRTPAAASNIYPSPHAATAPPIPTVSVISAPPQPQPASPLPAAASKPTPIPSPSRAINPSPARSPAASSTQNNQSAGSSANPVEVLGFSIPPDYKPTASDSSKNIGWN